MADRPKKKKEVGLRGDMGIRFQKGTGQFQEPDPDVNALDVEAPVYKVHMSLGSQKIGPVDSLAPKKNDDNNQEKIDKIKKKPIKWYVKVPGGGGGDHHHDDYSYHSYPWDGHGGSSGGSSSPAYSCVPTEEQTSGGYSMPSATDSDPAGSMTDGESAPSAATSMLSQQTQFGGAPPASPSLSQRFNIFPYRASMIPMALRSALKLKGITDIAITLWLKPADAIPGGQSVEMDVTLIPMENLSPPSHVYRKAIIVDSTFPGGASGAWTKRTLTFRGFDSGQEFPYTFNLARRSDVSPNYATEIWVMTTTMRGVR